MPSHFPPQASAYRDAEEGATAGNNIDRAKSSRCSSVLKLPG